MNVLIPLQVADPTLPTCQNLNWSMTYERGIIMAVTSEESAALMAAPAKTSLMGVAPPRPIEPIPNTNTAVSAAPAKASQMNWLAELMFRKAIPHTTNKAAPVLTPSILGSAIGLRVTDCISAPDTPSAAPHIKLNTVRDIRLRTTLAPKDCTSG
ncbi:hypothetical protein D3C76_1318320 [compost metagenome]